jgi:hypothetical protein
VLRLAARLGGFLGRKSDGALEEELPPRGNVCISWLGNMISCALGFPHSKQPSLAEGLAGKIFLIVILYFFQGIFDAFFYYRCGLLRWCRLS